MCKRDSIGSIFLLGTTMCVTVTGFIHAAAGADKETEILKITVVEPTFLSR